MKHPILKLKFVSLMIAGVFCFVPPVGAATQELRPLAKLERDLGRPNALEVDLRIKADDMYKSVVIGVLKDRSEIESALRQRYGDDSISLKNLKNIVVSFAGFGTTRFVYHLRFLFNDGRDMDLALYVFSRGGAYRNAELSTLAGIREDILKTGQDSITLSAFNPIDFTETLASEDQRTHYCLLAEYGGLDLDNIRHVLWKLFKNRAEAMSENELYNLVEIGLITDEEAEQLKTDKEGLADLIKKHLKTDDIDGFILRMENNGVAKYFQLYRKTQGRHIPDDPRRNNVLFRYDRHNDKWTCRLCDFENTSTTSLAELISSFQIFDKMYYEALRVPGLTVRHASSANVRAWHWTDKPIAKKTGFFKAAMAGLGGGEQAKRMLAEAMHEIQASTLMMSSDNCPYEALTHFLVQIGYVGYLKWVGPVAATGKTTAELESSVLRPLAAGERDSAHSYWDEYMRGVSEEDANLQAAAIDGAIKAGRVVLGADEALAGFFEDHIIKPMREGGYRGLDYLDGFRPEAPGEYIVMKTADCPAACPEELFSIYALIAFHLAFPGYEAVAELTVGNTPGDEAWFISSGGTHGAIRLIRSLQAGLPEERLENLVGTDGVVDVHLHPATGDARAILPSAAIDEKTGRISEDLAVGALYNRYWSAIVTSLGVILYRHRTDAIFDRAETESRLQEYLMNEDKGELNVVKWWNTLEEIPGLELVFVPFRFTLSPDGSRIRLAVPQPLSENIRYISALYSGTDPIDIRTAVSRDIATNRRLGKLKLLTEQCAETQDAPRRMQIMSQIRTLMDEVAYNAPEAEYGRVMRTAIGFLEGLETRLTSNYPSPAAPPVSERPLETSILRPLAAGEKESESDFEKMLEGNLHKILPEQFKRLMPPDFGDKLKNTPLLCDENPADIWFVLYNGVMPLTEISVAIKQDNEDLEQMIAQFLDWLFTEEELASLSDPGNQGEGIVKTLINLNPLIPDSPAFNLELWVDYVYLAESTRLANYMQLVPVEYRENFEDRFNFFMETVVYPLEPGFDIRKMPSMEDMKTMEWDVFTALLKRQVDLQVLTRPPYNMIVDGQGKNGYENKARIVAEKSSRDFPEVFPAAVDIPIYIVDPIKGYFGKGAAIRSDYIVVPRSFMEGEYPHSLWSALQHPDAAAFGKNLRANNWSAYKNSKRGSVKLGETLFRYMQALGAAPHNDFAKFRDEGIRGGLAHEYTHIKMNQFLSERFHRDFTMCAGRQGSEMIRAILRPASSSPLRRKLEALTDKRLKLAATNADTTGQTAALSAEATFATTISEVEALLDELRYPYTDERCRVSLFSDVIYPIILVPERRNSFPVAVMDADEEIAEFFSVKFTGRKMSHEEWQAFLDAELAKCKPEEFGLKILQAANEMHEINFLSEEERCSLPPPARPPARTFIPDALNEASSSVLRPLAAGESCLNLP